MTLLGGGQRCIRLGVEGGVSGWELRTGSLDADTAVEVPWGLRGGHKVGDTRHALSGRGRRGCASLGAGPAGGGRGGR